MNAARFLFGLTLALPIGAQTAPATDVYFLVFLRPDPDRKALAPEESERLQSAHMANIQAMAASGDLVAAGPFDDSQPKISGIFVFRRGGKLGSAEDARRLAAQDPTVAAHRNTVDAYAWHGPRGIGEEYVRLHKADPKTPEDMGIHPLVMLYRGPSWLPDSPLLREHAEYLEALRRKGKLSARGGVDPNPAGLEELAVYQRIPEAEARALMAADPAVRAGVLRAEHHGWWSAANVLPALAERADRILRQNGRAGTSSRVRIPARNNSQRFVKPLLARVP